MKILHTVQEYLPAHKLEYLYSNPKTIIHMGTRGYLAWLDMFTWEKIATQYERLYENVIHGIKI
jgi:glycosyltransferase involved in cell wall biosynthesis